MANLIKSINIKPEYRTSYLYLEAYAKQRGVSVSHLIAKLIDKEVKRIKGE